MPHVSSIELDEVMLNSLLDQFFKTVEKASHKHAFKYVGSELFTATEKIMLAKRLAAILLVEKGMPQHLVAKELHMSISTISIIALKVESGKYRAIRNIAGTSKGDLLDQIEKLLLLGMPPRTGRGRWKKWGR
ncbi:hypothetical protein BH11PAT3_BH11PAT3_0350 [soil metagenome]